MFVQNLLRFDKESAPRVQVFNVSVLRIGLALSAEFGVKRER